MEASEGLRQRVWRLGAAAVVAGLVLSATIVAPAYAARPGGGSGGKPTPPPRTMTLTYDPTPVWCYGDRWFPGGRLFGEGTGFTPNVYTEYKTSKTGFNVYTSTNTSGPDGTVAFTQCLADGHGGPGPYTVDVSQRTRNKLVFVERFIREASLVSGP